MLKVIQGLFGNKKEKDIKRLQPFVPKINAEFEKMQRISDDDLRKKTPEFKQRIADYLKDTVDQIADFSEQAENEIDVALKDELYNRVDALKKERNEKIEEILNELLPEAFAVVKQTAKRLSENKELRVKATDWDREIAKSKKNVASSSSGKPNATPVLATGSQAGPQ